MAIPTAIPSAPLSRRLGSLPGRTRGSFSWASKLSPNATVSFSMSAIISSAMGVRRASVLWLTNPLATKEWQSLSTRREYTRCTPASSTATTCSKR